MVQKTDIFIRYGNHIKNISLKCGKSNSMHHEQVQEFKRYLEIYGYEEDSLDFENILDELYKENMAYEIYRLSDEYTVEQYYEMMRTLDWEEIRDKYGID